MDRPEAIPADVARVHTQLERWRSTRTRRTIPADLWSAAARLAHEYGVGYTSRALRLDYYGLKRRLETRSDPIEPRHVDFVDLPVAAAAGPNAGGAGVADLNDGHGAHMRVAWHGQAPDLAALSRSFYGGGR